MVDPSLHMALVNSIIRRLNLRRHADFDALRQEGFIGLMKAAEQFDENRGYRFSTYAAWIVRGVLVDYLRKQAVRWPFDTVGSDHLDEDRWADGSDDSAARERRRNVVAAMLNDLPITTQRLVWLKIVEGMKVKDLAEAFGYEPREVSRIVLGAVRQLASKYGETIRAALEA